MPTPNDQTHGLAKIDSLPPEYGVATQTGVKKAEALQNNKVWGKWSTYALYAGVAMMAYIYSLDGTTTWVYTSYATSSFDEHSLLGAVSTVAAIIIAVGKPVSAKAADVFGRAEAWIVAIFLYTLGYIILAACNNIHSYAAGWWIRSAGYAAVQIMLQIIIGDTTSLRWRTLVSNLVSAPYFVNGFVASNIAADIYEQSGWRWGYGMFAILFPATSIPIIATLVWSQIRAYRLGLVHTTNPYEEAQLRESGNHVPLARRLAVAATEVDLIGLVLFTAGWTCLLLPLTLANAATLPWSSGKIIALLTVGPIILIGFAVWEGKFAKFPFIPAAFLKNRTACCAALIGFFDFISFYLQYTYQYSFIYITKDWSLVDQNYFAMIQTIALTLFGIISGVIVAYTRWYKWTLFFGLCVRLFAVGLMIHSKGAHGTTGELVMVQVLQGLGGGFASALCQTAAQGSVPHQSLAGVTAFVLLFAEIGGAIGTAIVSAIWRNVMPGQLDEHLAGIANSTQITTIYSSITSAALYPIDSPIRQGTIAAYTYTMKIILIAATVIAIIPPLLVLLMKDIRFGSQQNAVENKAIDGETLSSAESDPDMKKDPEY